MEERSLESRKAERRPTPALMKAVGEREDRLRIGKEAVAELTQCRWGNLHFRLEHQVVILEERWQTGGTARFRGIDEQLSVRIS